MSAMTSFLYVTDLHGNRWKYERTLLLAREIEAAFVINGGDMFPHGRVGGEQGRFLREFLDPHLREYQKAGIRYLGLTANDDLKIYDPQFEEICGKYPLVDDIGGKLVNIGDHEFLGMNLVSDFPFRLKDRARMDTRDSALPPQFGQGILSIPGGWQEIPDWPSYVRNLPTIEDELDALPIPRVPDRAVYVVHGPPASLGLDVCRGGEAVGSVSTLRFIKTRQPLLTLHGHIHESPDESGIWKTVVGRTVCIQPGQAMDGLTVVVGSLETMTFVRRILADIP
jgi:Icc-related predicted phosphoesterase